MKYKKYWQNPYGQISFYNIEDENIFAHKPFHWKDMVHVNKETIGSRSCIKTINMETIENSDMWRIIPASLANQVIGDFSEIIPEIKKMENRKINLKNLLNE
jgi:hypothetical protein